MLTLRQGPGTRTRDKDQGAPKAREKNGPVISILRRFLTQRFLTFQCVSCVKIKDTDDVVPVNPVWTGGGGGKMTLRVFAKYLKNDLADLHETL